MFVCNDAWAGFGRAKSYDVDEAYQIYSLLIPLESSYEWSKGTLVIQKETLTEENTGEPCLTWYAAWRFRDAVADYHRLNKNPWILNQQFQIPKAYDIVSSEVISAVLNAGDWKAFYKRYPESGGFVVLSAVGFN
jgi:hypothetical protein